MKILKKQINLFDFHGSLLELIVMTIFSISISTFLFVLVLACITGTHSLGGVSEILALN